MYIQIDHCLPLKDLRTMLCTEWISTYCCTVINDFHFQIMLETLQDKIKHEEGGGTLAAIFQMRI